MKTQAMNRSDMTRTGTGPLQNDNTYMELVQACFFTGFAAIQDNGISLIMSLEKNA